MTTLEEIGRDGALAMLERMSLIRNFEKTAYLRYLQGEIPGTLHQSQGQEAVAVGICHHLRDSDWITSTHRPHGHALAKGLSPDAAMAEIYGKSDGCLRGRGGSMHLGDPEIGILPSIAIVGGGITIAPGMAMALQRRGAGDVVVCFFGDGATNEGAFHEGVNYAAVKGLPVVFACENNLYGASTPFHETTRNTDVASRAAGYGIPGEQVDGMDVLAVAAAAERAVTRARDGGGPTLIEFLTYRYVGHSRGDARGYRTKEEEVYWNDRDPIPGFGTVLVDAGVATKEDVDAAVKAGKDRIKESLRFAQQSPDADPESAYDLAGTYGAPPVPVEPAGPLPDGSAGDAGNGGDAGDGGSAGDGDGERRITIAEALREGITAEMRADESVVLLGEDVGVPGGFGGAFGVYQGIAEEFGRDRVVDTPISEKVIVGASVGAAILGMKTLPDLQYADFVFEAMDELVNEAAKQRYMSGGRLTVPMVLRCPVGATQRGAQHGQCPESFFLHVPGIKVLCVSDAYTAKGGIAAALQDPDPVLVFEHKLLYGAGKRNEAGAVDARTYVPEERFVLPVGQSRTRRRGTDVTVLATFTELYAALELAGTLAADGVEVEVIDPVWLSPFDWDGLYASVRRTGALVVAHEAHRTGGWGAEVAARVSEDCADHLRAPVRRIASRDVPMPFAPGPETAVRPDRRELERVVRDCAAAVRKKG